MCSIFEEVRQEGVMQGRAEGINMGMEKGMEKGRQECKADLLKALRAAGVDEEILKKAAEQVAA